MGAADGLPDNVEDVAHGAAADRDDLCDTGTAGERHAESDQQRRDATCVANAGVEEIGIEDRAEVDLRYTHTASVRHSRRPCPLRRPTTPEVETPQGAIGFGEAHRVRDPVVTAGEGRDGAWHRGTKAVPECGDRRHADDLRLAAVGGDRCEIRQHPIIGNESECLDHVTSAVPAVRPDESPT